MTQTLKIGPLPDRTPVKLSLSLDPELHADLSQYAAVHSRTFGKAVTAADIAPSMLRTLIDSDAGFRRARKQLSRSDEGER